jgi:outer membrane protein, heavy metal efflux system
MRTLKHHVLAALALLGPAAAAAQVSDPTPLDALVAEARAASPEVLAARSMADAAAARVPRAGALPDPVLSLGVMNVPAPELTLRGDGMAMATVQVGQMLPPPGVRGAREAMARASHGAAAVQAEEVERTVIARLKAAYHEVAYVDRALEVLAHNRALLEDLGEVARGRYAVGAAPQQDVLRAHTEVTRLDAQVVGLHAVREAAVAEINALLSRPADAQLVPVYPAGLLRFAAAPPERGRFLVPGQAPSLGPGMPTLAELQAAAPRDRPALRAQAHRVAGARSGVRLAERERLPELEVMIGYGRQPGGGGMEGMDRVTAMVSVPLPVFAARKQNQMVAEAGHELAAAEMELRQLENDVAAEIAARYAEVARLRQQILLLRDGVIPQAQATIESAAAAYQAGRVEFTGLLDAQAMLFMNEIETARLLADLGAAFAALEQAAGVELNLEQAP